jgi:hypothetical protein
MKLLSNALLLLLAGGALAVRCANAATGDSPPTRDPAFSAGLATLKQATGFVEDSGASTDWKPNLQLLVGVKAVEGSKRTIHFVQLTTLPPPPTNSLGQPWQPILRTNDWAWSASNTAQFVSTLYPVRVRVFDETGRQLKEGQTPMAWGMLTNGLMDMCRLGFEAHHHNYQTNSPRSRPDAHPAHEPPRSRPSATLSPPPEGRGQSSQENTARQSRSQGRTARLACRAAGEEGGK